MDTESEEGKLDVVEARGLEGVEDVETAAGGSVGVEVFEGMQV